ncbi:TetR family transcriptional regulator [Blastococcus sp. SYSU DS0533]
MKLEARDPSPRTAAGTDRRRQTGGDAQGRAEHRSGSAAARAAAPRDRRDSRWDEHRRARRAALVDAAVIAVGRHGAGVGMDEIAAVAGTSKTVVYRHFADRSDLHVAVCTRVAEQLVPTLRAAMDSSDQPRDMLGAAVEAYLAFLEADPELYRFVVHTPPGPSDADDPITGLSDLVGEQAAAVLAAALDRAGRDPVAAAPWGHAVVGLVRAAADWWLRAGRPMPRRELAAHLTDLAWAGLSGVVTPASRKEDL